MAGVIAAGSVFAALAALRTLKTKVFDVQPAPAAPASLRIRAVSDETGQ